MINGINYLREMYPNFDEDSYQPDGIDLCLGKVYTFDFLPEILYGITKRSKMLPDLSEVEKISIIEKDTKGWILDPNTAFIFEVDRPIHINNNSAQFYLPRSSLLRMGLNIITALGDSGFNGHLSFLAKNETNEPLYLEEGVRFAQAIDFEVKGAGKYDGDYQNDKHKGE